MPGLELVESRGRPLHRPGGRRVRLAFLSEHTALRSHQDRASGYFFSDALRRRWSREVGRAGNRVPSVLTSHSTRFTGGQLGPLVCDLVPGDPLVGRAPAYLNLDSRFLPGVGLTGVGFVMRRL